MGRGSGLDSASAVVAAPSRSRSQAAAQLAQTGAAVLYAESDVEVAEPVEQPEPVEQSEALEQEELELAGPTVAEREKRRAEIEKRLKELGDELNDFDEARYHDWLANMSRFYHYSKPNYYFIRMQMEDATRVASASDWERHGRQLREGEMPMFVRVPRQRQVVKRDRKTGEPLLDDEGKEQKMKLTFFPLIGQVYDISQTEPIPGTEPTDFERQGAERCLSDLTRVAHSYGITVSIGAATRESPAAGLLNDLQLINPNAGGMYAELADGTEHILVREGEPNRQARTMAHELTHAIMHAKARSKGRALTTHEKETEAEAGAYALTVGYDVPNDDFSPAYLLNWARDRKNPKKSLNGSSKRILGAVETICSRLDALDAGEITATGEPVIAEADDA